MTKFFLATVAVVLVSAISASAQVTLKQRDTGVAPKATVVAPMKSKPKSQSTTAPRPISNAPLTAQECRDLGGSVGTSRVCKSKQSCLRYNESGKAHEVCISAQ